MSLNKKIFSLVCLFLTFGICNMVFAEQPCQGSDDLIISWLQEQTTVEQAKADNMVTDKQLGEKPVPFGFINDEWQELLARMQDGDELWEFESPPETWENLAGRKGIALIRECQVVASIVTLMN